MSKLTIEDIKYIESCKRKLFDGCSQYELIKKLKPHHGKALKIGDDEYLIEYVEDKGVGMASGYDCVYLKPLEWV